MQNLTQKFTDIFHEAPTLTAFAPGRINLIGEHTDYNGGFVFPAAIELGTYGAISKRSDRLIQLYSTNFEEVGVISFDLDHLYYESSDQWGNYPKGIIRFLVERYPQIETGFNIIYEGNIPNGASLSSSASIELLTGHLITTLFHINMNRLELVKMGQRVENDFIGVNSGIMDQFIIGFGKKDHAILLDTNTLEYHYVPTEFGTYKISIMNTNKRRELAESKYNERRAECEQALAQLQQHLDVQSLGEITMAQFEAYAHVINDEKLRRRAKHAISENARTKQAYEALKAHDFDTFGQLLNASHASLKDDYEVTGIELDTLAESAQKVEGVLGARMTGAGFAGCAIALVHQDKIKDLERIVTEEYTRTVGYAPSFYHVDIANGVRTLEEV
ncbi:MULTISPECIES: galactokinase [Staphylococcus]|uniref:Galactokinase n=1 Tax=Staphylococcus schleiferi TaxID=1295 RepID=A0A7Z7QN81_STASC|nr:MULTISPECIES: galactokinase [Staphylococcus]QGS46065.1 galactokinase [Mammaliicoccus fleurettii]EPD48064.1 galactokinase [Staphylococcus sp. HGB0015]NHA34490.1 galactokinase [Staphylococcus schleiferi]NHA38946.1 galactokinase [Staphylococcus schleiferi]NHA41053.1 galactokinase [Staphylococcus schleiferi]